MEWYLIARSILLGIGLGASCYFCATWTPRAVKARTLGGWAMFDTAGWVWIGFLSLTLSAIKQLLGAVSMDLSIADMAISLSMLAFVDAVVVVRAYRWWSFQNTCASPNLSCDTCGQ